MGKKKKSGIILADKDAPARSRHIKYLLYEDNPQHMEVLDRIQADKFPYIGIRHYITDFDGQVIEEDAGKPHFHIYQEYESAVYNTACAKRYGLLDDSGKVSVQFCRTITGLFSNALIYLTHLNCPEKEQYNDDELIGWSGLKQQYQTAKLCYLDKHVDLRTALYALKYWVEEDKRGDFITPADVIQYLINSPYLRYRNEPLFRALIDDHNQKIRALELRERLDGYNHGQIELNRRASGFGSSEYFTIEDLRDD